MDTGARLAICAIVEKNHRVKVNRGRAESMCRLTHVIPSVSIKDRTVVGACDKIQLRPRPVLLCAPCGGAIRLSPRAG